MKTKWQFFFTTHDFKFDNEHKFEGSMGYEELGAILFSISILPDKKKTRPDVTQTGELIIIIPFNYEDGKAVALTLLYEITERIRFDFGDFRINGGALFCERIPETAEEVELVGDKRHAVEIRFQEYVPPQKFDAMKFTQELGQCIDTRLVSQYNAAKFAENPIEKFIGFFKIIESRFPPIGKQKLREALEKKEELFLIFCKTFNQADMEEASANYVTFIEDIVHARHRCAHLKIDKGFGYYPSHFKVKEEVEPFLQSLEVLTREIIKAQRSV
jgi:hypothetical protein